MLPVSAVKLIRLLICLFVCLFVCCLGCFRDFLSFTLNSRVSDELGMTASEFFVAQHILLSAVRAVLPPIVHTLCPFDVQT